MTKTLALKPCPWCGPKGQLRLRTEEYCKIRAVSTEDGGEQSSETWHSGEFIPAENNKPGDEQ